MSKKAKTNQVTKFDYHSSLVLPDIKTIKTKWDLKAHFYTHEDDPQIEKDAKRYEQVTRSFIKRYKNVDFTRSEEVLLTALKDYEKLEKNTEAVKIIRYFAFRSNLNVNDTKANKKLNLFSDRFRKLSNELLFFSLRLGKVPVKKQRLFLKSNKLAKYRYLLLVTFLAGKHQLSEEAERILNLRSRTSSGMWAEAVEKIVSNRTVQFRNNKLNLPEAFEILDTLHWQDKNVLWKLITEELIQISEFCEHELTAVVTHEKVSDELRGYKQPYSATVQAYENDERSVEALIEAISTRGFSLSKKFYKLKAKLHKKKHIPYVNKYDSIGEVIRPDFSTSVDICRDVFYGVKREYGEIFDTMLKHGQLDVFPTSGKRGGAFMASTVGLPTFVFLNHTSNFKSLETLAHEMGHAIHAERSKLQPEIYQDFSTTTAETASTLFEQLVLDRIYEQLTPQQQINFLHDKISRDIATVQRQVAFFNFELEMHRHIRAEGLATKDELATMMQRHLQSYLGPAVEITERDGYSYVYIPHIRYGFYVYTYAYGHLISNLMANRYQIDKNYIEQIDSFLCAGGKDTVENIFRSINIDTKSVNTFVKSLDRQAKEISQLQKLTT
jgi:oligoendopeptidase F